MNSAGTRPPAAAAAAAAAAIRGKAERAGRTDALVEADSETDTIRDIGELLFV